MNLRMPITRNSICHSDSIWTALNWQCICRITTKKADTEKRTEGVNSNGNIECQLDDDTCNKIRSIIDSYRELQAMRK